MGSISNALATAFRNYITDGVPASGAYKPDKRVIRDVGQVIEQAISNVALGSLISATYVDKATIDDSLLPVDQTIALVYADPLTENNDLYVKVGASGSGYWQNTGAIYGIVTGLFTPYVAAAALSAGAALLSEGNAAASAAAAAEAAGFAEEFSGPSYADTTAGVAATAAGHFFRTPIGTTPETYNRYERTSTNPFYKLVAPLITAATLAATTGAALVGWIQEGANAVLRNIRDKLRETVTPMDFGAAGDANPDDNTAGTDDTAAVQRCFTYAATKKGVAVDLAGRFYKVQWVRIPERGEGRRWFVYGRGGGFVNPATSTSEAPCLYHSTLAASGAATRTYQYSDGVTLDSVNFCGGGYGVGYAHMIAGHLHHANCSFQNLEDGLLTIGVAGCVGLQPRALYCKRAFHAPRKTEYVFTAGYTEEVSRGWADGYSLRGGSITKCVRGLLHKGSDNEGVVSVTHMVWGAAEQSYVELWGLFKGVEIAHNWCEYTKAEAGTGNAVADCIRLYRFDGADTGGESAGQNSIHHNNFFFSAPSSVGGIPTYRIRRVIDARVNCHIHSNTFTCATGGLYDCIIYNAIGSSGTPIAIANLTPTITASLTASGFLAFADADLAQFGDVQSVLYMQHDNGKTYLLTWHNQPIAGSQNYDVRAFTTVYSGQFAPVSAQWGVKTSHLNRVAPVGIACDFTTNVTGLAAPAGTVKVWSGLNGGVVNEAGAGTGGLTLIERNTFQNIDMRLVFASTNSGRYIMRHNIKRT